MNLPRLHVCARAALLAISLFPAGAAATAAQTIDTLALRAHTRFLADDLLRGRGTGTQGEHLAAAYIASQLTRLGLQPLPGTDSYFHPVPLRAVHVDDGSSVSLTVGRDTVHFSHGADFIVNTGGRGAFRDFGGPALFLGQPIHAPSRLADPARLAGQVAVFLGPLGGAALEVVPVLQNAGVTGVVLLVPDAGQFDLFARSRGDTRFYVDADVDDPVWQPALPVLIAGPRLSSALLTGASVTQSFMQGAATEPLDLARTLGARIRTTVSEVSSANVAAVLPGADPALRDEYVAYTAHFDHLGVSTPDAAGDSIYNGFSDNAAGVAMLLAIAEAMRDERPHRSVVFLFFTGEERGLLGSTYMAGSGVLPLQRFRALINLDAGAPPVPPVSWRIQGGDSPLGREAAAVAAQHGWATTLTAASPNSDHWPFLRRGVPAVFIIPGDRWENTTDAQRLALRERWDRYHQAGDHWHSDFPFEGLARYAEFGLLVGRAIGDRRQAIGDRR